MPLSFSLEADRSRRVDNQFVAARAPEAQRNRVTYSFCRRIWPA